MPHGADREILERNAEEVCECELHDVLGKQPLAKECPPCSREDRNSQNVADHTTTAAMRGGQKDALPVWLLCGVPGRIDSQRTSHGGIEPPAHARKIESGHRPDDVHDLH